VCGPSAHIPPRNITDIPLDAISTLMAAVACWSSSYTLKTRQKLPPKWLNTYTNIHGVKSQNLLKNGVFWDVTPCGVNDMK
jgi:hypothetical protein